MIEKGRMKVKRDVRLFRAVWSAIARPSMWLFLTVVCAVLAFLTFKVFNVFIGVLESDEDSSHTALRNVGIVLAALFGGGFAIWRGIIAAKQANAAQTQVILQQDRDYASLFTRAIEQLGTMREVREYDEVANREIYRLEPNIEVRLGAIYTLERVSRDSERDHIAVMETLCAYVRENSPISELNTFTAPPRNFSNDLVHCDWVYETYRPALKEWLKRIENPKSDVQAALDSIGRRSSDRKNYELKSIDGKPNYRLDLRKTNLRKANLSGYDFRNAIFDDAHLEGANLKGTFLEKSSFKRAKLSGANLEHSRFYKANFYNSDLKGMLLKDRNILHVNFERSNLEGSIIRNTTFKEVNFRKARFKNTDILESQFCDSNLAKSFFLNANLLYSHFIFSNLRKIEFLDSSLQYASFTPIDFEKLFLDNSNLSGANFYSLKLFDRIKFAIILKFFNEKSHICSDKEIRNALNSCFGCASTILPSYAEGLRPLHWHPEQLNFFDSSEPYKVWKTAKATNMRPPWVAEAHWTGW